MSAVSARSTPTPEARDDIQANEYLVSVHTPVLQRTTADSFVRLPEEQDQVQAPCQMDENNGDPLYDGESASLDRRLRLARDRFTKANPHAAAASMLVATRAQSSVKTAPDDLQRPYGILKSHYGSRMRGGSGDHRGSDSEKWSPDSRDFCRTYQRILPSTWASRIVECKTPEVEEVSRTHHVLFVWRDDEPGLWVVDLCASGVRGLEAEASYEQWEVTPQHFATLIKPRSIRSPWRGVRKMLRGFVAKGNGKVISD